MAWRCVAVVTVHFWGMDSMSPMFHFAEAQIAYLLIATGLVILGLLIAYGVIYLAVRNALRSHSRWIHEGGVAAEERRRIG